LIILRAVIKMLKELKKAVYEANLELVKKELVIYTWGNASGICREKGLVVIKPSGVDYDALTPEDLVVLDLDGNIIEGKLKQSSDTPTHLVLYKEFTQIGGIVHTHSPWATIFAQAGLSIPPLGTTHADYFYGEVPCTRKMFEKEINGDYEKETGNVIVETYKDRNINSDFVPGVLVNEHGPFCWGKNPEESVYHAVVMEEIAMMAFNTLSLRHMAADGKTGGKTSDDSSGVFQPMSPALLNKHFSRKHGKNSYYGQR